jgi:hypothetical protein
MAWVERAELLLERALDTLERRLADDVDPVTVAELTRAIETIGGAITTRRALIPESHDEQPPRRSRPRKTPTP